MTTNKKTPVRSFLGLLKKTLKAWNEDDPFRQSAVIAYYAIFSLPALLVIIIALAGVFFGNEAVTGQLSTQISGMMGGKTAEQVEEMVANASIGNKSIWATIIALVTLVLGATGVFIQLQKTLNIIWDVEPVKKKKSSFVNKIWLYLRTRLLSFGIILSIGFLLLVSLVISSLLSLFSNWMEARFPDITVVLIQIANFIISLGLITVLFALMFKFLPDAEIRWRDVWTGAFITALLFSIGKFALGIYFGKSDPGSVYGTAGSVILIMLWISYSCMILFFGSEFTKQYATKDGEEIEPKSIAQKNERIEVKSEDEVK